jgi:hypothetical protein
MLRAVHRQSQGRLYTHGTLLPWTSWEDALDREMKWYLKCPIEHGYPRFATRSLWRATTTPLSVIRTSSQPHKTEWAWSHISNIMRGQKSRIRKSWSSRGRWVTIMRFGQAIVDFDGPHGGISLSSAARVSHAFQCQECRGLSSTRAIGHQAAGMVRDPQVFVRPDVPLWNGCAL